MTALASATPTTRESLPMAKAITAAMRDAMAADDTVIVSGEDVGQLGGVFRVTAGLLDEFGADRVRDTPLAESGIVGTAIGMAMGGYRPVVEIQFDGFVFPAFNQITTQLAKLRYRSGGNLTLPLVIRIPYGGGVGAVEHHGESPETYFAHTPGLRVVTPADAADAYTLLRAAIASEDPVIYFEPKSRYWVKGEVARGGEFRADSVADELSAAHIERDGSDISLIGYGPTVATLHEVSGQLAGEGVSAQVMNLRSLNPIDMPTLVAAVSGTGRAVIAHEAPTVLGPGTEIAAELAHECFYSLEAPIARVGGAFTPYPAAAFEHEYLPNAERIRLAVRRTMEH
ncbi:alpha-ketoacid dehydrogenase subunit beta [Bowdeniella nasicola]|uniref:Alpha-ketoacid dehydrogenase subunit beta n=1 Tax=Bowdeniella nasicola TaxID=208480 RepID=A0A1Q5Q231_9ACTO|nr:transketolase C-terminal domain-containing protein [Bowdeniella nasicola]OKL53836.1 alpha-ketoacid dehydrogenase subunit beta [Bowdeniella nasicola]